MNCHTVTNEVFYVLLQIWSEVGREIVKTQSLPVACAQRTLDKMHSVGYRGVTPAV